MSITGGALENILLVNIQLDLEFILHILMILAAITYNNIFYVEVSQIQCAPNDNSF